MDEYSRGGSSQAVYNREAEARVYSDMMKRQRIAEARLRIVQQFLRNICAGDSVFPEGYSGQMLRQKAEALSKDFNPEDFT